MCGCFVLFFVLFFVLGLLVKTLTSACKQFGDLAASGVLCVSVCYELWGTFVL